MSGFVNSSRAFEHVPTVDTLTGTGVPFYFLSYSLSMVKYRSSAGSVKNSSWRLNQAF
jgi:hypothetical protein